MAVAPTDYSAYSDSQFAAQFNVSRETMARLTDYVGLLGKWQQKINLIGSATLPHIWARHMADCAQIFERAKLENGPGRGTGRGIWLDLGSGAGFPGLVVALLLADQQESTPESPHESYVHLVEADRRKAAFLRTIIAQTSAPARVHAMRIEVLIAKPPSELKNVNFITARALAPLQELLSYVVPFCNSSTVALLSKGQAWQEELTAAQQMWKLQVQDFVSCTDPMARILAIRHAALK